MVALNFAYTAPVNRPGQSVLTIEQVWKGLERKVRFAQEFVPLITDCDVVSEEGGTADDDPFTITRFIKFDPTKASEAADAPIREVVKHYPPCRVDFLRDDGTKVENVVAQGPSGEPSDLQMTYIFEWRFPNVEAGSKEAVDLEKKVKGTAGIAVESTIETIRRLVSEGKIN